MATVGEFKREAGDEAQIGLPRAVEVWLPANLGAQLRGPYG
ncbi:hypothetical protein [Streptomyces sp. NPDC008121]